MVNEIPTFQVKTGSIVVPSQAILEPVAKGKISNINLTFTER